MALDLDLDLRSGATGGEEQPGASRWRKPKRALRFPQRVVARRHSRRDSGVRRLLAIADIGGVCVGLLVATTLTSSHPQELLWGLAALPVWIVVFKAYGLYDRDMKRISHGTVDDLPWIFHAVLLGSLLLLAFFRLTPLGSINLRDLAVFAVVTPISVAALRAFARRAGSSLLGPERLLLIGEGIRVKTLARKLCAHPEYAVELVGLISRSPDPENDLRLPHLGQLDEIALEQVIERHEVERLVVAHQDFDEEQLIDLLRGSRELGVKLSVLPQLFDALGPSVELDDVEGITVLGITPPVLPRSSRFLKRAMDIVGAGLLLAIAAPFLIAIAIAIKLDSPGPVFFRQTRIGRGGSRFKLVKCRTMSVDAEQRREDLLTQSKDPGWLLLDHDPRVTRVGHFLRLSSLDELPQLWNVLKGEMSLVGPRPIVEDEDRQLDGWRRTRIDLTPGITGLWQVLGRTSIPFEEMIKLDYLYVTNWSLWTDVSLMLKTLPAVLLKRGAN
ncbi:MAG TPA: sugar transferase [Solirubrobacterales bacterium]|nr:sugar transferase [Solirubrobacterales bacterium]